MSETFDPYQQWLDIPPEDQPPHYYRLLNIDLFESAHYVISRAADLRIGRVEHLQTDQHKAQAGRIINEIKAARACLLSARQKAKYDRELLEQLGPSTGVVASRSGTSGFEAASFRAVWDLRHDKKREPIPTPPDEPPRNGTSELEGRSFRSVWRLRHGEKKRRLAWTATAVAIVLFVSIVVVLLRGGGSQQDARRGPNKLSAASAGSDGTSGVGLTPEKPTKFSVPNREQLKKAEKRLTNIPVDPTASKLLEVAIHSRYGPDERFVLLTRARDSAAAWCEVKLALQVVDRIAERYEIDVLEMKAETLSKLGNSASSRADFRAVASSGLPLVDQAIHSNRPDVARRCAAVTVETARKARSSELEKEAKLAALRAKQLESVRSPAKQLNLGDQWWELAQQEENADRKEFQLHAADWYHKALPNLKGSAKKKIQKRIETIFIQTAPPMMYLADMHPEQVRVNTPAGCTIRSATEVGGEKVFHGLFVHPSLSFSSLVSFDLHKVFRRLRGAAGISDMVRESTATPLTFRIVGNGKLLWKSRPLTKKGASQKFRVDISGVSKLELLVDCPGPAESAHAVWVDPVVLKR